MKSADPDLAEESAWMKQRQRAELEELKARQLQLEQRVAELKAKAVAKDWLCYLPPVAGSVDFMRRACDYLEKMRARIEAAGERLWLNLDHGVNERVFLTRVFEISKFRAVGNCVFCSGQFTDPKYRDSYKGVSPDNAVFAGDFDLIREMHAWDTENSLRSLRMEDLPTHTHRAAQSEKIFGLAEAVCMKLEPAYGRTRIIRCRG